MDLVCPKCQGAMRAYERSGVTVDQCTECRGIFLDRGELERLADAETSWHQPPQQAPPPVQQYREQPRERYEEPRRESYGHGGYAQPGYGHGGYGHPRKKKKSFLDELFDD